MMRWCCLAGVLATGASWWAFVFVEDACGPRRLGHREFGNLRLNLRLVGHKFFDSVQAGNRLVVLADPRERLSTMLVRIHIPGVGVECGSQETQFNFAEPFIIAPMFGGRFRQGTQCRECPTDSHSGAPSPASASLSIPCWMSFLERIAAGPDLRLLLFRCELGRQIFQYSVEVDEIGRIANETLREHRVRIVMIAAFAFFGTVLKIGLQLFPFGWRDIARSSFVFFCRQGRVGGHTSV